MRKGTDNEWICETDALAAAVAIPVRLEFEPWRHSCIPFFMRQAIFSQIAANACMEHLQKLSVEMLVGIVLCFDALLDAQHTFGQQWG